MTSQLFSVQSACTGNTALPCTAGREQRWAIIRTGTPPLLKLGVAWEEEGGCGCGCGEVWVW